MGNIAEAQKRIKECIENKSPNLSLYAGLTDEDMEVLFPKEGKAEFTDEDGNTFSYSLEDLAHVVGGFVQSKGYRMGGYSTFGVGGTPHDCGVGGFVAFCSRGHREEPAAVVVSLCREPLNLGGHLRAFRMGNTGYHRR